MLPPELIAKLTECASANLVTLRDASFFWQTVFSRIVIAGLLFEGPELVHELLSIIGTWLPYVTKKFPRFNGVVSSKRFVELAKLAAFLGWILIIVGLGGELRTSSRIVDLSARIEECSDAKVTKATLEAGDAATSAKTAREEAEAATSIADEAKRTGKEADVVAGKALKTSDAATNAASKAQERVDEVAEQADDIDRDIYQLQTWMDFRHVTNKESLIKEMGRFKEQEIDFVSYAGDPEGESFCNELFNATFSAAYSANPNSTGKNFTPRCATEPAAVVARPGFIKTGLWVWGPNVSDTDALSHILANNTNSPAEVGTPAPRLTIFVGFHQYLILPKIRAFKPKRDKQINRQKKP